MTDYDCPIVEGTSPTYDWPTTSQGVIEAFSDGNTTVDKMLDYADLTLDWYIPSKDAIEFILFIRLVLGEEPENTNPKAHYFLMDCIFQSENVKPFYDARGIDFDELSDRVVVLCTREFAKALTLDTKVATPNGYVEMRDIQDNDTVYDRDGKETKVLKKSKTFFTNTYETVLADGRNLKTSYNHDNILWKRHTKHMGFDANGKRLQMRGYKEVVITTEELHNELRYGASMRPGEHKYFIPRMNDPIAFPACNFVIDPYTVGVILGDGRIDKKTGYVTMTCHKDDLSYLWGNIPYEKGVMQYKKDSPDVRSFGILGIGPDVKRFIGVENSYGKRVPVPLMTGSVEERIAVLQGLMDTDGTIVKKGSPSFTSTSLGLAEDVLQLVRTLGGTGTITEQKTPSTFGKAWRVNISINNIPLFRLKRKADRQTYVAARDMVGVGSVELIASEPTQCLTVDSPTQSFILENGVVTHNSVMVVYFVLFMAAKGRVPGFGKVLYGIYVSDSMRNNVETTMTTIAKVYQESKYLRNIFEETRLIQTEVNFIRKPQTRKEIELYHQHVIVEKQKPETVPGRMKRTLTMTGLGAATGGRGSRDGLARPDFAIFDDMIPNEKDADSETVLDNVESTIEADILKALSGNGNFAVAFGTPYNKKDPIYRRIEEGSWLPVVFPRALKFDEDTTEENFVSVWPDRHTYKQCRKDYKKAKRAEDNGNKMPMRKLLQENYLRISNEEDRMISDRMIQWYSRVDLEKHISQYNIYISTDFTTTGSDGSDYSGVAAWAVGSNSDLFLLDLTLRKMEITEQYNEVFRMNKHYSALNGRGCVVGVEVDGQQRAHVHGLKEQMVRDNEWFTFGHGKGAKQDAEGINSRLEGGNKHWRFRMMLPMWQNHKIWFPKELKDDPSMYEMLEELKYVTYTGFGCLSADTTVTTPQGEIPIVDISDGDSVWSQTGDTSVILKASKPILTGVKQTYTIATEDTTMHLTASHKVLTMRGYVRVENLVCTDLLIRDSTCISNDTDTSGKSRNQGTTNQLQPLKGNEDGCTELYGKQRKDQFQKEWRFIIKTRINKITNALILSYYWQLVTSLSIQEKKSTGITEQKGKSTISKLGRLREKLGIPVEYVSTAIKSLLFTTKQKIALSIAHKYVENGEVESLDSESLVSFLTLCAMYVVLPSSKLLQIRSAVLQSVSENTKKSREKEGTKFESAFSAQMTSAQLNQVKESFVRKAAEKLIENEVQWKETADNVEKALWQKLQKQSTAQIAANVSILKSVEPRKVEPVYDFEVKETHNYMSNGVVLHNSLHDDGLDLISQMGAMEIMYPMRSRDGEDDWSNKKIRSSEGIWDSEEITEKSAYDSYT